MSDKKIYVYVNIENTYKLAGYLWCHIKGATQTASFQYTNNT